MRLTVPVCVGRYSNLNGLMGQSNGALQAALHAEVVANHLHVVLEALALIGQNQVMHLHLICQTWSCMLYVYAYILHSLI